MKLRSKLAISTVVLWSINPLFAGPEAAKEIKAEYEAKFSAWSQTMKGITTPELRTKAMQMRPDPSLYAKRIWPEIRRDLKEDWALSYITWILPQILVIDSKAVPEIQKSLEVDHVFSGDVGKAVIALSSVAGPDFLKLAEKIKAKNPDPVVKGEISLAIALNLASLGEGAEISKQRLTELREAIIKAAESKIGNTTVGDIAADEIYKIKNLMKGRLAPDLSGVDQTGRAFKLSDYRGKVVVLTFWSGAIQESEKVLSLLREKKTKLKKDEVEVIGVNNDSLDVLRKLTGAGLVTWRNFSDPKGELAQKYRVNGLPISYVINKKGEVSFVGVPGTFVEMAALGIANEKAEIDLIRLE